MVQEERRPDQTSTGRIQKVLIVEDQRLARDSLASILRESGRRVRRAENGENGLHVVRRDEAVSVAILDIALPGELDGVDLAERIQLRRRDIGLIFVSAFLNRPDFRQRVEDAGLRIAGWIQKPLNARRLERLKYLVGRELEKSWIRRAIDGTKIGRIYPDSALQMLLRYEPSIDLEMVEELASEYNFEFDPRITLLYEKLHELDSFAAQGGGDDERTSLQSELRERQQIEARKIGSHLSFRSALRPGVGDKALGLVEEALKHEE